MVGQQLFQKATKLVSSGILVEFAIQLSRTIVYNHSST